MPKKINDRAATSKPGQGTNKRNRQKTSGCTVKPGNETPASSIIAGSLHSLKLVEKLAVEVEMEKQCRKPHEKMDYPAMYKDLVKAFQLGMKKFKNETTSYNPMSYGYDLSKSLSMILHSFESNLLQKGWEYAINYYDEAGYFFAAFKNCNHTSAWQAFPVKPIVKFWEKKDKEMLELYLLFMQNFKSYCGLEMWDKDGFNYADAYTLEDRIENIIHEYEEPESEEAEQAKLIAKKCVEDYKTGEAAAYWKLINSKPILSVRKLKNKLNACKKRNSLLNWMKEAVALIEMGGNINDFDYWGELYDEEDGDGLRYIDQVAIPWDEDDFITTEHLSYLDAMAQGVGVCEPILFVFFKSNDNPKIKGSFDKINSLEKWPELMAQINIKYSKIINSYIK